MSQSFAIPSVSVTYAHDGTSTRINTLGMRPMQERAYQSKLFWARRTISAD
jgi:hypothetical protein